MNNKSPNLTNKVISRDVIYKNESIVRCNFIRFRLQNDESKILLTLLRSQSFGSFTFHCHFFVKPQLDSNRRAKYFTLHIDMYRINDWTFFSTFSIFDAVLSCSVLESFDIRSLNWTTELNYWVLSWWSWATEHWALGQDKRAPVRVD